LALALARGAVSPVPLAVARRIDPAAARAERKVGSLALGSLALRPWQGRANQGAMDGPLVSIFAGVALSFGSGLGLRGLRRGRRVNGIGLRFGRRLGKGVGRFIQLDVVSGLGGIPDGDAGARADHGFGIVARERARLAPPRRRRLGTLVLVIRLARRATRLLHLVVDHRDDGVVGDAALARAIVVENVTEADPALLHQLPRSDFLSRNARRVPADTKERRSSIPADTEKRR
jgi:hypothetical protein